MADNTSDLKIKVTSDTSDARKELHKLNMEVSQAQKEAARANRRLANVRAVGAGFGAAASAIGAGVTGYRAYRSFGGRAVRSAAMSRGARFTGRTAARIGARGIASSVMGGAAGIAGPLAAVAALVVGTKVLIGLTRSLVANAERQSQLMGEQLRASLATGRTIQESQAVASAAADPLGRSVAYHRSRTAQLGTGITGYQTNQLGGLAGVTAERAQILEARSRSLGAIGAPYLGRGRQARNLFSRAINAGVGFQERLANAPGARALLGITGGFGGMMLGGEATNRSALAFGGEGVAAGRSAEEERRAARNRLRGLQFRGPGSILGAPETVTAGGESEYLFRVRQQRRQLQIANTEKWQQELLAAIKRLVELGEATPEDLEQQRLEFSGFQGVQGID